MNTKILVTNLFEKRYQGLKVNSYLYNFHQARVHMLRPLKHVLKNHWLFTISTYYRKVITIAVLYI